jgi:cytochrome c oxidase cbb3-type subunit 3
MNKATNLTEPALLDARTDEQLATVIRQGRGKMPAFASLPPAVVSGLVGRIRALRGR